MIDKKMITIVIPTRERHEFLKRTLDFLCEQRCQYRIIIADSSIVDIDLGKVIGSVHIDYFNFPMNMSHIDRIQQCLAMVTTPYVVMLGDDDFINVPLLPKLCNYLDQNKECVAIDGREIRVRCDNNGIIENIVNKQTPLFMQNIHERISVHCQLYWPTFYAVHRTHVLINSFKFMKQIECLGYLPQEVGASIATIMQGTYNTVSDLYLIRQNGHMQSTKAESWFDFVQHKNFCEKNMFLINQYMQFAEEHGVEVDKLKLYFILNKFYAQYKNKFKLFARKLLSEKWYLIIAKIKCKIFSNNNKHKDLLKEAFYKQTKSILSKYPFGY